MAKQTTKFKISIKELTMEFEGSHDLGQALQAGVAKSLGGLLETQRQAMSLPPRVAQSTLFEATSAEGDPPPSDESSVSDKPDEVVAGPEKAKKGKRKSGGTGPKLLVLSLKNDGFFNSNKTVEAIREALRDQGHNIGTSTLSTTVQRLTQNKELFRSKENDTYVYRDSPHDGSA